MGTLERIGDVVPALTLTAREREAILELSYLAIAADRKLMPEEIEAFRAIASRLREVVPSDEPPPSREVHALLSDRELNALLDKYGAGLDRAASGERLHAVAGDLRRPEARDVGYKVAYALALCDLETSDEEFEFDLDLIDALELPQERAEELADEVMRVFNGSEL